jgi:hypothetical protein
MKIRGQKKTTVNIRLQKAEIPLAEKMKRLRSIISGLQKVKAVRIAHGIRTEYIEADCKFLNKIANTIIKYGAISFERLQKITKLETRTICWALWHLEAIETAAELYILPG